MIPVVDGVLVIVVLLIILVILIVYAKLDMVLLIMGAKYVIAVHTAIKTKQGNVNNVMQVHINHLKDNSNVSNVLHLHHLTFKGLITFPIVKNV